MFELVAHDETEKIAYGTHKRFIVDVERFQEKANGKREKSGYVHAVVSARYTLMTKRSLEVSTRLLQIRWFVLCRERTYRVIRLPQISQGLQMM